MEDSQPQHEALAHGAPATSVAKTVVFLASDESMDLNGASLHLDRGELLIPTG